MTEFTPELVRATLTKATDDWFKAGRPGYRIGYLTNAIMNLVESIAVEAPEPVDLSEVDIRERAYKIVIAAGQGGWSDFHERVARVAENLQNGFTQEGVRKDIQTITVALDIDTSAAEAKLDEKIASKAAHIRAQEARLEFINQTILSRRDTIRRADVVIASQNEIIQQNAHILQSIFERVEWRREAWNDLKAVLIRAVNKRLGEHVCGDILKGVPKKYLEQFRSFVASYQFDPEKP